jgi:hypothetical protein
VAWWPDPQGIGYWPEAAPRTETIEAFYLAFEGASPGATWPSRLPGTGKPGGGAVKYYAPPIILFARGSIHASLVFVGVVSSGTLPCTAGSR